MHRTKTYEEALEWASSIVELAKHLPEGVGIHPTGPGHAGRYVLKNVDPLAIRQLAAEFGGTLVEEAYYSFVDVTLPKCSPPIGNTIEHLAYSAYYRGAKKQFRFFYRQQQ